MVTAIVQNNIPLAFSDHLSPLLQDIFPDSDVAKNYATTSTKTTCIVNGSLAPYFKANLITAMKEQLYFIAVDGSNDNGIEK